MSRSGREERTKRAKITKNQMLTAKNAWRMAEMAAFYKEELREGKPMSWRSLRLGS